MEVDGMVLWKTTFLSEQGGVSMLVSQSVGDVACSLPLG